MAIEAVEVPTRFRETVFAPEDANAAFELLSNGQAAKYGEFEDDGSETEGGQNAAEALARSRGITLNKQVEQLHGRKFGVSVWRDKDGNVVGALLPRAPKAYTKKDAAPKKK